MHCLLIKDIHVVRLEALPMLAIDLLKLSNVINTCLINPNIFLILFLTTKSLWMCSISDW